MSNRKESRIASKSPLKFVRARVWLVGESYLSELWSQNTFLLEVEGPIQEFLGFKAIIFLGKITTEYTNLVKIDFPVDF